VTIVGRTYLLRGRPVTVIAQWEADGGPQNVLIELVDRGRVVRPFRGLRRIGSAAYGPAARGMLVPDKPEGRAPL
jgi:hypothetical protein